MHGDCVWLVGLGRIMGTVHGQGRRAEEGDKLSAGRNDQPAGGFEACMQKVTEI